MSFHPSLSLDPPIDPTIDEAYWIAPHLRNTLKTHMSMNMEAQGASAHDSEYLEPGPHIDYYEVHCLMKVLKPLYEGPDAPLLTDNRKIPAKFLKALDVGVPVSVEGKKLSTDTGSHESNLITETSTRADYLASPQTTERSSGGQGDTTPVKLTAWDFLTSTRCHYYELCEKVRKRLTGFTDCRARCGQLMMERKMWVDVGLKLGARRRVYEATGRTLDGQTRTELALGRKWTEWDRQWEMCGASCHEAFLLLKQSVESRATGAKELSKVKSWVANREIPKLVDELRRAKGGLAPPVPTLARAPPPTAVIVPSTNTMPPPPPPPKRKRERKTNPKTSTTTTGASSSPVKQRPTRPLPKSLPSSQASAPQQAQSSDGMASSMRKAYAALGDAPRPLDAQIAQGTGIENRSGPTYQTPQEALGPESPYLTSPLQMTSPQRQLGIDQAYASMRVPGPQQYWDAHRGYTPTPARTHVLHPQGPPVPPDRQYPQGHADEGKESEGQRGAKRARR
ncbi:MAG: hypothetical protein M4579_001498 [Chaenotheca gracillima]|nr:MAG: hypothetical protein M4579_001498 [Chaenotheca gracillima]